MLLSFWHHCTQIASQKSSVEHNIHWVFDVFLADINGVKIVEFGGHISIFAYNMHT